MDEAWVVAVPLYFVSTGLTSIQLGQVTSAFAVGDVLGFVLLPFWLSKWSVSKISIIADVVQAVLMIFVAALAFSNKLTPIGFVVISFLIGFWLAAWFACSDTVLSSAFKNHPPEKLQKWIVLSNNAGPVAGPAMGSLIFGILGLPLVAALNSLSFLFQLRGLSEIIRSNPVPHLYQSVLDRYRSGMQSITSNPVVVGFMSQSIAAKFMYGFVPFAAFKLKAGGASASVIGITLSCIGIGSLTSVLTYKAVGNEKLPAAFSKSTFAMNLFSLAVVTFALSTSNLVFVGLVCGLWGYFITRYQIQARALRQLTVPPTLLAGQIIVLGLLVRALTPLSGFLFGFALSESRFQEPVLFSLAILLVGNWIMASRLVVRNFSRMKVV